MSNTEGQAGRWRFWIDRGGTFTDVIGRAPDGGLRAVKLLSNDPGRGEDAVIAGIRRLLGVDANAKLPFERIAEVRVGTTVATNALLERKGVPTLFVTNAGLEDALVIRDQARPDLFALEIRKHEPLYKQVFGVSLRLDAEGKEVVALDETAARRGLEAAREAGCTSCAICLMHAWRHPEQERRIAELARAAGFETVVASREVSPLIRYLPRAETTVTEAYLQPLLRRYTRHLAESLPGVRLLFMKSDGGLAAPGAFTACQALLSGPAGGVVGAVETARTAGYERVIGFDMGGTSTDVCYYGGEYERQRETIIGGNRIAVAALDMETVAAGGGSIVGFDGERLVVGPEAAGADPGPASYRNGGPLTVTDCNVFLGRIRPEHFPCVFGLNGDEGLDRDVVSEKFTALAQAMRVDTGGELAAEEIAAGALGIAIEHMAGAIKRVSIARGHDPRRCVLNCFGGAGGQHACAVADALGIEEILIHSHAGVLSALGIGRSDLTALREQGVEKVLSGGLAAARETAAELEAETRAVVVEQGAPELGIEVMRTALLRYGGSETTLSVPLDDSERALRADFEAAHRRHFGFVLPEREIVIAAVRIEARGGSSVETAIDVSAEGTNEPIERVRAWFDKGWREVPLYRRAALASGTRIAGPAIVIEDTAITVVESGWTATVRDGDELLLARAAKRERRSAGTARDPILLEVMGSLFMTTAEQMGEALRQSAQSVNVRERLDFSCAVFGPDGALVANAPHMPVHLGAMSETVRALTARERMAPGEVWVMNDPYAGGTHLPDITVVTPIFVRDDGDAPDFFVASRAHHADLGGATPGSMPPDSRCIEDEGVLIRPMRLVVNGRFNEAEMLRVLADDPHPARKPEQNLADLRAQVAANERGRAELERLIAQYGLATVQAYMRHVNDQAASAVRRLIERLPAEGRYEVAMDNGAKIVVALRVDKRKPHIAVDFSGTSPTQSDNFNAPSAVVRAAVLYVLRTLVEESIPLNDGCLENVGIKVPPHSMLSPEYPAAVVAGNVEVSQCLCDALFAATGSLAACQGTMNNLSFGNERYQHYETLAGGAGAGDGFNGTSAVHTHMTNSRLTDPEILEFRYPVLLEQFSIRKDSGGAGKWHGGDGIVRRIRFREPMTVAILSNRRNTAPFGLAGGGDAAPGVNRLLRADGSVHELAYSDRTEAASGDAIEILTPGGGGYGYA
ncbi:MAG: hydantoinase B/oxoprolinase family protein [Gammaproteobacteria bacterium]